MGKVSRRNSLGQVDPREVEYYAANVTAWYASALEHDKSLFTLAGGGLGVLVSLLTTVGFDSWITLIFFVGAIGSFVFCLWTLLAVFKGNMDYIQKIVREGPSAKSDRLKSLDRTATRAFMGGVVFAVALGMTAAWNSFNSKTLKGSEKMSDESKSKSQSQSQHSEPTTRSFNGAANLSPASVPSKPQTAPAPATSQPSTPTSQVSPAKPQSKGKE